MADIPEKSVYYKRERRKFALITYLLTAIFLIVALLQWVLFSFVYVYSGSFHSPSSYLL